MPETVSLEDTRRGRCARFHKPMKVCFAFFVVTGLALVLVHGLNRSMQQVEVRTAGGLVTGAVRRSAAGRLFLSYEGLPYAQPPLRFKDPQPQPARWNNTFSAWLPRDSCLVLNNAAPADYVGEEDCLYLNVYTPELGSGAPVAVWLGDGDFEHRIGDHRRRRPDRLVDSGVVVVTVEYRLGVFGFLSTEDLASPGNYGLKDQVTALLWIRENIAAFGGDPTRVTICGRAAAAASVGYHLLSPLSKGLFSRAIAIGGSPLNPWAFSSRPREAATHLVQAFDKSSFQNSSQLVEFLRSLPRSELAALQRKAHLDERGERLVSSLFAPSAEPASGAAFLTEEPWAALERGLPNAVPLLIGSTSNDGKHLLREVGDLSALDGRLASLVGPALRLATTQQRRRAAALVRSFYFGDDAVTSADTEDVRNLLTDMMYVEGVDRMARAVATLSPRAVYYYRYIHEQDDTQAAAELPGADYTKDAGDILRSSCCGRGVQQPSEKAATCDAWLDMLINFIKTGKPTPGDSAGTPWPAYTVASPAYLEVGSALRARRDLLPARMDFWRSVLPPRLRI